MLEPFEMTELFYFQPRLITQQLESDPSQHQQQQQQHIHLNQMNHHHHPATSINSLINAERIPSEQFLGLNPQEASILNFLRVDAAERQRDKR